MMSEHKWLLGSLEEKYIEPTEKGIFEYCSKVIGGQAQNGGTFAIRSRSGEYKVIGFFRTNGKGIEIRMDSNEKYFFKWKPVSIAVKNKLFPEYEQLTLF